MGFAYNNDKNVEQIWVSYSNNDPSDRLLSWQLNGSTTYNTRYNFSQFKSLHLDFNSNWTFHNHLSMGLHSNIKPISGFDYDEPRISNKKYKTPASYNVFYWISSDYRKPIAIDFNLGYWQTFDNEKNGFWYELSPRFLIADNLFFVYEFNQSIDYNITGYVNHSENEDSVFFGRRNYNTIRNSFELDYILNKKSSLTFRFNHNWSRVSYIDFHMLQDNGTLMQLPDGTISEDDINGNFFNVDFAYSWQFAPGSELSVVWKNSINDYDSNTNLTFFDNFERTLKQEAQNSFSIRVLYYLDYLFLKKSIKKIGANT